MFTTAPKQTDTSVPVSNSIQLISGEFSIEEAREILSTLINDKIVFHQRKNFSSNERFGCDNETSVKRIPQLIQSQNQLLQLLEQKAQSGTKLRVTSTIVID
jgi:hypothetical protein